jgi:hypothetical protein
VALELADRLGVVEVWDAQDVQELGACRWGKGEEALAERPLH